jgi:hypothetical protein
LRHASNQPIFSSTVPIAGSHKFNAVANRFADPGRDAAGDPAASGFNSATDAGSNPATDAASGDGCIGQNHEFRVHPFQS